MKEPGFTIPDLQGYAADRTGDDWPSFPQGLSDSEAKAFLGRQLHYHLTSPLKGIDFEAACRRKTKKMDIGIILDLPTNVS